MNATVKQVSDVLCEVGETHHRVFRIVDGLTTIRKTRWYADWLINVSSGLSRRG
jgi:hypothetical protein